MMNISLSEKSVTKSKLEVVSKLSCIMAVDIGSPVSPMDSGSAVDSKDKAEKVEREAESGSNESSMNTKVELGATGAVTWGEAVSIFKVGTINLLSIIQSSSFGALSLTGESGAGMLTKDELKLDNQCDVGTMDGKLVEQVIVSGDVGSSQAVWTGSPVTEVLLSSVGRCCMQATGSSPTVVAHTCFPTFHTGRIAISGAHSTRGSVVALASKLPVAS